MDTRVLKCVLSHQKSSDKRESDFSIGALVVPQRCPLPAADERMILFC